MVVRRLLVLFKWGMALGLIAGLLAGAYWVNHEMQAERIREGDEDRVESPSRAHDGIVTLNADEAQRAGLEETPARPFSWTERVPVHGEVIANPEAVVEVRATSAGILRSDPESPWPSTGRWVRARQTLGWIDVRIAPQERLTLQDNLNNARIKEQGAETVVALQRERVRRVESVSKSQIVPGQQLDDAKVLLAEAETQLAMARAAVALWQEALDEVNRPGHRETTTYSQPIIAPADGEVTELLGRPGMAIEAGSLVARVVDFRRLLVRMEFPSNRLASGPPGPLRLVAIASPEPTIEARPIGPAPGVDAVSQRIGYWYAAGPEPGKPSVAVETDGTAMLWRPGLRVKADLKIPNAPTRPAAAVPVGAVLYHQGRALVYVVDEPGEYERREVRLLGLDGDSWIVEARRPPDPSGLKPGEVVVHRGAQVLLSEEFRGAIGADDD